MKNFDENKNALIDLKLIAAVLFLFIFLPACTKAQQTKVSIGTEHKINSKILKEERRYAVSLPESYESDDFYVNKKYPVLILLDANYNFASASGMLGFMGRNEQIPEMIVVAIYNTNRNRDLTPKELNGGGDNFLQFIEKELLPKIEKDYRTLPYRVLVGHSLGGLFAVDTFLKQEVFNAFLVIDPSLYWQDQRMVEKTKKVFANGKNSFKSTLYFAQANNPFNEGKDAGTRGKAFQEFHTVLSEKSSENLRYKYTFFDLEDHFTIPQIGIYQGMLFIFEGYKFPLNTLTDKSAGDIKKHYEILTRRYGVDIKPPGRLLNGAGLFLLNSERKVDKAIEILKLNNEFYPKSYITYNSLADAYNAKGNKKLALKIYKKSLELNPNNQQAQNSIRELTQIN